MRRVFLDIYPSTWSHLIEPTTPWMVAATVLLDTLPSPELWRLSMPPIEVQRGHSVMFTTHVRRDRGAFR